MSWKIGLFNSQKVIIIIMSFAGIFNRGVGELLLFTSSIHLVGGFNPFEIICSSNWIISPRIGVKIKKSFKPSPSLHLVSFWLFLTIGFSHRQKTEKPTTKKRRRGSGAKASISSKRVSKRAKKDWRGSEFVSSHSFRPLNCRIVRMDWLVGSRYIIKWVNNDWSTNLPLTYPPAEIRV